MTLDLFPPFCWPVWGGIFIILQLEETDGETENYISVENEFVLETVFALFKERNKDYFTFE